MGSLTQKHCIPCEGGMEPLTGDVLARYLTHIPQWTVSDDSSSISRNFSFASFMDAIAFVHNVAEIAEAEGHHPDIYIYYTKVTLTLYTHAIGGLSENDFIVAAKIDCIEEEKR